MSNPEQARRNPAPDLAPLPLPEGGNTLADLTATEYLRLFHAGEVSALDYARACADRIELYESRVRAFAWFDRALLETRAAAVDARRRDDGTAPGALAGVPVGVKDIFNTYDMPTGMGSPILAGYTPGNDARVVSNIRLEHGIIAGKTVTAEFAVHQPGPTRNPWDLARTPGTSSSGSAAAVAIGMVPVALASQTAGSIIRPASYCGIMGLKPSYGLIPRTGVLKTTDTLDTVGLMARSVDDLTALFEVVMVQGHNYPIWAAAQADPARQKPAGRKWRVGVVESTVSRHEQPAVRAQVAAFAGRLEHAGCTVQKFALPPEFAAAHEVHETIYRRALAYYFMSEWDRARDKISDRLTAMIEGGLAVPVDAYRAAIDRQTALARHFDAIVQSVDVLIAPSTAGEAPLGLSAGEPDDTCLIWTMCGAPAISLPLLKGPAGLPVGLQVVARRFNDRLLLDFARFAMTLGA